MNSNRARQMMVYVLIFVAIAAIVIGVRNQQSPNEEMSLSQLVTAINEGTVEKIVVGGDNLEIEMKEKDGLGEPVIREGRKAPESSLQEQLQPLGVDLTKTNIEIKRPSDWGNILNFVSFMLPALLVVGIIYYMLRQAQGTNNQAMSFGKSKAKMFTGEQPTVTFDDVAGLPEAKQELGEVVEFLKDSEKFKALGARIPAGVLLIGPPGTGKTLLAKAVSGEAGVPFFSISGSEFVEMFVGVGASRVRDMFEQARRHHPCIIFIDEIDAVGRQRGAGLGGSHDEREQTLNQILVEMDGFETDQTIIIIAATNRPDILDPALLRPGRFDRSVVVDRPDVKGREAILGVHSRGKPLAKDVDLRVLAKATPGFSGADIENMVNEGAILAARRNQKQIRMMDLENAIERVQLGPERKSSVQSEQTRKVVAYHEAGHAVIGRVLEGLDRVRKVSIVPRGMAGGVTWFLPDEEGSALMTRSSLKNQLSIALGGRVAEEIAFGADEITNGASGDLQQVAKIARAMITQWGMSPDLSPIAYGKKEEMVFLGREISEQRDYSDAVAEKIDAEVSELVDNAYSNTRKILDEHRDQLEAVTAALLEHETLNMHEFEAVWNGEDLPSVEVDEAVAPVVETTEKPVVNDSGSDTSTHGSGPLPMPSGA